jgi:hypothetical protein
MIAVKKKVMGIDSLLEGEYKYYKIIKIGPNLS